MAENVARMREIRNFSRKTRWKNGSWGTIQELEGKRHQFLRFKTLNPFQASDAMWRHTFHLSLICMSFAH
jgi:hypothetical protein